MQHHRPSTRLPVFIVLAAPAYADFTTGWLALQQQDYVTARAEFQAGAEVGDARAAIAFGVTGGGGARNTIIIRRSCSNTGTPDGGI